MLKVTSERDTVIRENVGIVFLTRGEEQPARVLLRLLQKWTDLEVLWETTDRPFARFLSANNKALRRVSRLPPVTRCDQQHINPHSVDTALSPPIDYLYKSMSPSVSLLADYIAQATASGSDLNTGFVAFLASLEHIRCRLPRGRRPPSLRSSTTSPAASR